MMNRRLRDRLTEPEILQVFVDVLEALACMHHLKPSLLHRDLKVENILQAGERCFKLCDFGSAATVAVKPPSTTAEIRALEQDIMCHTTLQYRAPEMVDVYQRLPIDDKSGECTRLGGVAVTSVLTIDPPLICLCLVQTSGPWVCFFTSSVITPPRSKNMAHSRSSTSNTRSRVIRSTPPT